MRSLAVLFALLLGLAPLSARAASLDRDWARIYNPPGTERVLGVWPAPGGGVDIAVDRAGQLFYIQYNSAGTLTAERATGLGSSLGFSVLASDGLGGFVAASLQDTGMVAFRISPSGQVQWWWNSNQIILYPSAIEVKNGRLYLGADYDYGTSYTPYLRIFDLDDGAVLCEDSQQAYFFQISDMEVREDGGVLLIGFDNSGCDCFAWTRSFDQDCHLTKTNGFPGYAYAQYEMTWARNVLLTTSHPRPPDSRSRSRSPSLGENMPSLENYSFAVTWFHPTVDVPTAYLDSRYFMVGGARAEILEMGSVSLIIGGEHDAGGAATELIIGTVDDAGGLDIGLVRPDVTKSYDALQLAPAGYYSVMLAKQSNISGGSPARVVLLFDQNRSLLDHDVEGNIPDPFGMVIGSDGGIYTVGSGPLSGVVLTKLVISGATGVAPQEQVPAVSRLGMPVPNPATSVVSVDYDVAANTPTTLDIYDPAGRLVTRLVDGSPPVGRHVAKWNALDVPRGVYFVRFKSGTSVAARKLVIE